MQPPAASTLATVALVPLVAWRIYVRVRRARGRQRLSRYRGPISLGIYSLLIAFITQANLPHPVRLLAFAAALAAGAGLARYALHRTRFETTREGLYYTPHGPIGLSLAALFVARLAYRFVEVYVLAGAQPRDFGEFARSPLTLGVFGLLAGYQWWYMAGLVRWRQRVLRAKREREASREDAP